MYACLCSFEGLLQVLLQLRRTFRKISSTQLEQVLEMRTNTTPPVEQTLLEHARIVYDKVVDVV